MTRRHTPRGCLPPVLTVALTLAAPGSAADLADFGRPSPPYESVRVIESRVATVVPACSERRSAMLLHCRPRENVFVVDDVGLAAIEGSIDRRRPPYRELVPR